MTDEPLSSKDIYAIAYELLDAAVESPTKRTAIDACREVLQGFDEKTLARVASCVAIEVAWGRLPSVVGASLGGWKERWVGLMEAHWRSLMGSWLRRERVRLNHTVSRPGSSAWSLATVSSLARRRSERADGVRP